MHILHHYFMDFMIVEKLRSVENLVKKNCAHSTETKLIDRTIHFENIDRSIATFPEFE